MKKLIIYCLLLIFCASSDACYPKKNPRNICGQPIIKISMSHDSPQIFICNFCGAQFGQEYALAVHKTLSHTPKSNDPKELDNSVLSMKKK